MFTVTIYKEFGNLLSANIPHNGILHSVSSQWITQYSVCVTGLERCRIWRIRTLGRKEDLTKFVPVNWSSVLTTG